MALPNRQTTQEMINAVYGWLGEPSRSVLRPTIVCVKFWTVLGKRQLELQITDRTFYLAKEPLTVAENQLEVDFGEAQISGVLALEKVTIESGVERVEEIPVIGDARDANHTDAFAAYVFRNPENNLQTLRFTRPFPEAASLRAWVQPRLTNRPSRDEAPMAPEETANLLILDTAEACLPEVAKTYDAVTFSAYARTISQQKLENKVIYDQWRMKTASQGVRKRTPYGRRRSRSSRAYPDYGGEL
jgi:hypothetical protein